MLEELEEDCLPDVREELLLVVATEAEEVVEAGLVRETVLVEDAVGFVPAPVVLLADVFELRR